MRRAPLAVVLLLAGCTATTTANPSSSVSPSPSVSSSIQIPSYLLNPDVTQGNIIQTICVPGYTATIRPPSSYTTDLKKKQIGPDHDTMAYEEDHWIPLEVGGAPRNPLGSDGKPSLKGNLWPEPIAEAHRKDVAENADHKAVCNGTMTLAAAQLDMFTSWGPR